MKKYLVFVFFFAFIFNFTVSAQTDEGYQFKMIKELPATPVKNQAATGTCYTFSTISMLESELLRMGKGEYDLSEMFMIYNFYLAKAERYIRMHGEVSFPTGGAANDVVDYINKVGLVPEEVYSGLNYGSKFHNHGELHPVLENYLQTITQKGKVVSTMWKRGMEALLNTWLGDYPSTFTYKGKTYTPQSFAKELGLNPSDYILITSFNHHPFYEKFVMDVPDNWTWQSAWNVPIDDLEKIIDNAIMKGYTVTWATDLGGGQATSNGDVYVVPQQDITKMKRDEVQALFKNPIPEKSITQDIRQQAYDNYQTTDDHGMHITGIANDQTGAKFYYVKNSWGIRGKYNGYIYVSAPFLRLSTTTILVNKHGIPSEIAEKLGIKQ